MNRQNDSTTRVKSAALLAAEAAFAPTNATPTRSHQDGAPLITVLRAKRPAVLAVCASQSPSANADAFASSEASPSTPKAHRVFLLKSPQVEPESSRPGAWPSSAMLREQGRGVSHPVGATVGAAVRAKRKRHRPSPVTVVFSAMATTGAMADVEKNGGRPIRADAVASRAHAPSGSQTARGLDLAAALADIGPTFEAICSAGRFAIADPLVAVRWDGLSRAVDQIEVELRGLVETDAGRRKGPAGDRI